MQQGLTPRQWNNQRRRAEFYSYYNSEEEIPNASLNEQQPLHQATTSTKQLIHCLSAITKELMTSSFYCALYYIVLKLFILFEHLESDTQNKLGLHVFLVICLRCVGALDDIIYFITSVITQQIGPLVAVHQTFLVIVLATCLVEYLDGVQMVWGNLLHYRWCTYGILLVLYTIRCFRYKLIWRRCILSCKKRCNITINRVDEQDALIFPFYVFRNHPSRHSKKNWDSWVNALVGEQYVGDNGEIDWVKREADYSRKLELIDNTNYRSKMSMKELIKCYKANVLLIKKLLNKEVYYLLIDIAVMRDYAYGYLHFPGSHYIPGWLGVRQYWYSSSVETHFFIGAKQSWDVISRLKATGNSMFKDLPSQNDFLNTVPPIELWYEQIGSEYLYEIIASGPSQVHNIANTAQYYTHNNDNQQDDMTIGKIEASTHGYNLWNGQIQRVASTFFRNPQYRDIMSRCVAQS